MLELKDDEGRVTHVVLSSNEYKALVQAASAVQGDRPHPGDIGRFIPLSNRSGGTRMDVYQLAHGVYHYMRDWTFIIVGHRNVKLDKMDPRLANSLDAIIRRCFLPPHLPYLNTAQATPEVVDALCLTGLFTAEIRRVEGFFRPIQCLTIHRDAIERYLARETPSASVIPKKLFLKIDAPLKERNPL